MVAILGPEVSRRRELLGLAITAAAAVFAVVVPVTYLLTLVAACGAMAGLAPSGRRAIAAVAAWVPVSAAVVLGELPLA